MGECNANINIKRHTEMICTKAQLNQMEYFFYGILQVIINYLSLQIIYIYMYICHTRLQNKDEINGSVCSSLSFIYNEKNNQVKHDEN